MNLSALLARRIDRFVLPVVSRHALVVLKREYGATAAHQILYRSWRAFGPIIARGAEHSPARSRLKLSFAAASAALHEAMVVSGVAEGRASAIVAEISARTELKTSNGPWWLNALTRSFSFGFLLPVQSSRRNPLPPHTLQPLRPNQALTPAGLGTGWLAASRCSRIDMPDRMRRFSLRGLVIAGAVVALGIGIIGQRSEVTTTAVVGEAIVVSADTPRLMLSKRLGSHTVIATDMRDELSIFVVASDGSPVPVRLLSAEAQFLSGNAARDVVPVVAMNDHLMAQVDPAARGSLNLSLGVDSEQHELRIELPLPPAGRTS